MSLLSAFSGETYSACVASVRSPLTALRTRESMQIKKAVRVLPEPVGAEMSVVLPARMCGQPCSCGSVGVLKRLTNQSRTSGWAHSSPEGASCGFSALIAKLQLYAIGKVLAFRARALWFLGREEYNLANRRIAGRERKPGQ